MSAGTSTNIPVASISILAESPKIDEAFQGQTCHHSGCPDAGRMFKQGSAFKCDHQSENALLLTSAKETYGQTSSTLQVSNIHMRGYNFATPGYLKRHEREVHATPTYVCPVTSCKRNRRGFSRKDNLVQHMRRTHDQGGDTMNTSSPSPPASSLATALRIGEMTTDQVNETGSVNVDEDSAIQLEVSTSVSSDKFSLIAKLQELETAKEKATAKFDGDIDALKRVLSFM